MMSVYYNPITEEYPRHPGDIQLIDSTWEVGQSLPEPWVEVDFQEPPIVEEGNRIESDGLELIEGVWKNKWVVIKMTQEEIDANNLRAKEFEEMMKNRLKNNE